MTTAVWFAAALLFAFFGFATRTLDLPARLAVRFATGSAIAGAVMWIEYLVHIPWSRAALLVPLVVCGAAAVLGRRAARANAWRSTAIISIIALLCAYGVLTARETSADLLYFWGPKGQAFFLERGVDVAFLKYPFHYLMHPDYPPLQPMLYAWSSNFASRFSYWGALLLTPLCLLATALAFRGFAARAIGDRNANAFAILLAALLAFGNSSAVVAGGADAQLVLFEVIALSALTFADDATLVAAVALAGAAFTKVEGAAFAAVVIVVYALLRRDVRRMAILAAPAIVLLGSWILFARHEQMIDSYALGGKNLYWSQLPVVLAVSAKQAQYESLYLPWIAALAPLAIGRNWRRALLPLAVAIAAIGYAIFFYIHVPDASWWVESSARRVLLTPLVALLVASAAASE